MSQKYMRTEIFIDATWSKQLIILRNGTNWHYQFQADVYL